MKDTKQTPDPHITLRFATADDVGVGPVELGIELLHDFRGF